MDAREYHRQQLFYNAGSELNKTTSNYEMFFREYDPALGRMTSVDPVAGKYSSLTPYNYAFNTPVNLNDPSGADPYGRSSLRDWAANNRLDGGRIYQDADGGMYGSGVFGSEFIRYGPGNSILMGYLDQMWADAEDVKSDKLSPEAYAARYGENFGGGLGGLNAALNSLMPNQVFNVWAGKQKANGGYRGEWQTYSSTIRDLVEERGYKLRLRYRQQAQGRSEDYTKLMSYINTTFGDWAQTNHKLTFEIDYDDSETSFNQPGRTRQSQDGSIKVYINPMVLYSNKRMYVFIGHEFMHVLDYDNGFFNDLVASGDYRSFEIDIIMEFRAYLWSSDADARIKGEDLMQREQLNLLWPYMTLINNR
jgi:RHS repeat-associated protein